MRLYYVHDPMCSWCWGFRPTWLKITAALETNIEVKYILGGLASDTNEPMPKAMQNDISSYWRKIQSHIPNTEFNFDFWGKCQPRRSTFPACRAVISAKSQNFEFEMIESIQHAYYLNARNPSNDATLVSLAEELGLDGVKFSSDLNSPETQQKLDEEISFSKEIGVQGFPSMILEKNGMYQYVPLDYNDPSKSLIFILRKHV